MDNTSEWVAISGHNVDIDSLKAFIARFHRKFDLLSFGQILIAIHLNGGEVNEDIGPIFLGDEAEAFAAIEPFDRAGVPI
jgi:hypothetical protein